MGPVINDLIQSADEVLEARHAMQRKKKKMKTKQINGCTDTTIRHRRDQTNEADVGALALAQVLEG